MVNMCVSIIFVFANKQAFWRWRFPNMGIEGVELSQAQVNQTPLFFASCGTQFIEK
jgi:hypothetical protein